MKTLSTPLNIEDDPRWSAVVARDPRADGQFVYAVKTTGIYCRPSSLARLPKPQNVEFFDTAEEAEAAGYRPSKRASKDQSDVAAQHAATVAAACRQIETAETLPALNELADAAGLSSFHFHRVFKAATGLTPKGYAAAHRSRRVRQRLADGDSVTDALYDAGFNSNSRFYEAADQLLGMKPGDFRAAGQNNDIRFAVGQCSLGAILVAQSDRGICAILLGDDPHQLVCDLQDQFRRANLIGADAEFEQLIAHVVGFIEAPAIGLDHASNRPGFAPDLAIYRSIAPHVRAVIVRHAAKKVRLAVKRGDVIAAPGRVGDPGVCETAAPP